MALTVPRPLPNVRVALETMSTFYKVLNGIAADSEVLWTREETLSETDNWGCNYKRTVARVKVCSYHVEFVSHTFPHFPHITNILLTKAMLWSMWIFCYQEGE